jgi:LacI family transcriptional regulator
MSKKAGKSAAPMHSSGRVRLADVARLAGVDASVVSRAINGDPKLLIRPETRQRVFDAIQELSYRPNVAARNLRRSTSDMYGLIIPDFANPIYAQIIAGAEAGALPLGKYLFTSSVVDFSSDGYLDVVGSGRIDGLLIAGTAENLEDRLDATGVPWLFLNRRSSKRRRHVVLDDEGAAAIAVNHLTELGHERIGHLAGPPATDTGTRRRSGYFKAMANAGLKVRDEDVVVAGYTDVGGASAMARLLTQSKVSAVMVANVASAIGALWAAHEAGVSVPDELSVVAIHDLPLASFLIPPLTTVRMPLFRLGQRGIEILQEERADAHLNEVVASPMELVMRQSTAQFSRSR